MDTQVLTPQLVFMHPQRLVVPLFQRPYVWNEELQWEPLWSDVTRVADRVIAEPGRLHQPHFLGAVVLQQLAVPLGHMQTRTIIDGQQRLTTLQLMMDAVHLELVAVGATQPAQRIEALIANSEAFCEHPEDRFKVWPTNRDRDSFNAVMAAEPPLEYEQLALRDSRMVQAHRYFASKAREWLTFDTDTATRAAALERSVRELLQVVVIDLAADENAQEIFETLNARGAQLTAADLIKNFVFQRLMESGVDVESAYEQYWTPFETGFWESEVSAGRVRYPRSSIFLNHWLIARTGEEIVAREVFTRFKTYADFDADVPMFELLQQIHAAASLYRRFTEASQQTTGPLDRLALFGYRTGVMESEVVKPLVLCLLDPQEIPIPDTQVNKALACVESWLVRRMLVRATTKDYTRTIADLITQIQKSDRRTAGDLVEDFLRHQPGVSRYWPDDDEVRREVTNMPVYRRLSRARLRMVLEAIEDDRRGHLPAQEGLGQERVTRSTLTIEHVMPRKWHAHWPLPDDITSSDRDALVQTLGNLTLLTGRLNSRVSNGAWDTKREGLESHDVLFLNRDDAVTKSDEWTESSIRARTQSMLNSIIDVWPVPEGHRSDITVVADRPKRTVDLADLIAAGILQEGMTLYARPAKHHGVTATLLPDGGIDVDGSRFRTPSGAGKAVAKRSTNGWAFWGVDPEGKRSLRRLWREYVEQRSVEADDSEVVGDDDDDDA